MGSNVHACRLSWESTPPPWWLVAASQSTHRGVRSEEEEHPHAVPLGRWIASPSAPPRILCNPYSNDVKSGQFGCIDVY